MSFSPFGRWVLFDFSAWCLQWPYSDVRKKSLTFYIWPDDAKVPVHAGPGDASAFRPLRRQVKRAKLRHWDQRDTCLGGQPTIFDLSVGI